MHDARRRGQLPRKAPWRARKKAPLLAELQVHCPIMVPIIRLNRSSRLETVGVWMLKAEKRVGLIGRSPGIVVVNNDCMMGI